MKKNIATLLFSMIVCVMGRTQSTTAQEGLPGGIPGESVFVQFNESLVFSGEHLLYKVYCFNNKERQLTKISKMAYVSLVDKDGKAVFTHKIRLENGSGYGDFFVPTSISTGSYKLLGYSEWMKNFGQAHYFQSDIHIINPYKKIPEAHLEQPLDSSQKSVNISEIKPMPPKITASDQNEPITLVLEKTELGMRNKLVLKIDAKDKETALGSYALSIRRTDEIPAPVQTSSTSFFKDFLKRANSTDGFGTSQFRLPELRGEVITGTISNKQTQLPVADQRISLSLPGDNFLFKIATSDEQGKFRFILDKVYDNVTGAIQVLSDNWDMYNINIESQHGDYSAVQLNDFKLSAEMKDYILQKSIQNQIENGFGQAKSDSVIVTSHELPYYNNLMVHYDLDDYTRFYSIKETIIEVVNQVSIRQLVNGDRVFEIRPEEGLSDLSLLPMVFVDGLFLKRHEDFMDFGAKKIKSISFSRDKVILGSHVFQGVLSIKTVAGGFYNNFYAPHIINLDLLKPLPKKEYFNQAYGNDEKHNRIPDFRHQLLWEPNLDLSEGSKELTLFTSDVPGEYELVLEGFLSNGRPVSINRQISVR